MRRTRELLHRALIGLILEKGYGRVTIQNILDRADLGRSTFYAHYRSKDDLLMASALAHVQTMFAQASSDAGESQPEPLLQPVRTLLRLIDANRPLHRAMVGDRSSDLIARSFLKLLTRMLTEHLRPRLAIDDENRLAVLVAFLVGGLNGLTRWWLDTEATISADEVYARFEELASCGLRHFAQRAP